MSKVYLSIPRIYVGFEEINIKLLIQDTVKGGVSIGLSYCQSLLLLLLLLAALADLKTDRVPNGFIAAGIVTGLTCSHLSGPGLFCSAASMLLAFLLMYPLFKIGTLGAGDIKVLIMTGCFLAVREFLTVLAAAFAGGALLSIVKLLAERNGKERMFYLLSYVSDVIRSGHWKLYGENLKQDENVYCRNKIHFTIPVLFGAALKIGGLI